MSGGKLYICFFFIDVVRENFVEFLERNTNDPANKALNIILEYCVMHIIYKVDIIDLIYLRIS